MILLLSGCSNHTKQSHTELMNKENMNERIILGGGCFWCTEAVFQRIKGVDSVISGYMGGGTKNPNYMDVCTGLTGHIEVVQVSFQPNLISLKDLLEVFFISHDPTTLNRQGADEGTQYKSVIFYENEQQRLVAMDVIRTLEDSNIYDSPIVTELVPSEIFYPAEDYHQNYYHLNKGQAYCSFVITPKIQKVERVFKERLK